MLLSQRISELCDAILAGRFIGDRLAIVQELRRYVEEEDCPAATSIGGIEVQRAWKKPADIRPAP